MPGRYRNWYGTSYAGTLIDGVKRVSIDSGLQADFASGDGDAGPTLGIVTSQLPTFSVNTINALSVVLSAGGTRGAFTTTLCDTFYGVLSGGGAVSFATNDLSFLTARATTGDFNQLAAEEFTVSTVWLDGVTGPITVSVV